MAKLKKVLSGHNTAALDYFIVKANTTITKGDFVNVEAGYLNIAAAGEAIIGVADETVVQGATATKLCAVIVDPTAVFEVISDEDTTGLAAAGAGTYYDIVGTTGAMKVDSSSTTTSGQLMMYKFIDANTSLFVISENQMKL